MKQTEYKVIYWNDCEEVFYCMSIIACFAAATHYMNSKAMDSRIKYIYDTESKLTYSKFQLTFNTLD